MAATKTDSRTDTDRTDEQQSQLELDKIEIIPKVRKCDFVQFKNRFDAFKRGIYAVEVLESDSLLDQEIQDEVKNRQNGLRKTGPSRPAVQLE
jgi:hypothetical protein